MPLRYELITAPTEEPVTVADIKQHARVDITDDDDLLYAFVVAARERVENATRRQLVSATYKLHLAGFPRCIVVPRPPLQSVSLIEYVDTDGGTQTLATSEYTVDAVATPGLIVPAYNVRWPSTRQVPSAVTVTFIAGYGAAAVVPVRAKAAIQLIAADLYEHREEQIVGTIRTTNISVASLLAGLLLPEVT